MTDNFWTKLHNSYSQTNWIAKSSLFAETTKDYLPAEGKLLELGAGLGQDSAYFNGLGYSITATDLNTDHLKELADGNFTVEQVDLRNHLPFSDKSFDIVYAHLSLHYFEKRITTQIFDEIYRVLKPEGIFAFFTNSTQDPEYNTGTKIEPDFFEINGISKRYLSIDAAKEFAHKFEPLLLDNKGETYKDSAKGVHNLIRFIGKKI